MDVGTIIGIAGVTVAAVSLFLTRTVSKTASDANIATAKLQERVLANENRIAAIDREDVQKETGGRVLALEKVMEMVIKNLTVSFVVEKHRPHPEFAAQDDLIEKYANDSITQTEQAEFLKMIQADAQDMEGETANRLYAGAILELGHARDIIHVSSPAFTTLSRGDQMIETMRMLNADTKEWLQVKIERDKTEAKTAGPEPPPQLDRIEANTEDIKKQLD